MYNRILVPLDGSDTAEMVLPYVSEIASKYISEIILFAVHDVGATDTERLFYFYLKEVQSKLQNSLKKRGASNIKFEIAVVSGKPVNEIINYANTKNINLIVIASRGLSNPESRLLGNIADTVLRISSQPVMLIRNQIKENLGNPARLIKRILLPLDGSLIGEKAIPLAQSLAKELDAEIVACHVLEPAPGSPLARDLVIVEPRDKSKEKTARDYLERIKKLLISVGVKTSSVVLVGYPANEILNYSEQQGIDLITISTHGRSGVGRWMMGSVTDKIINVGNTPVLVEHAVVASLK